jgi:hypothetical protein
MHSETQDGEAGDSKRSENVRGCKTPNPKPKPNSKVVKPGKPKGS